MKRITQISAIALTIVLLSGCKKEENPLDPLAENDQVSLTKNQLKPFELALIQTNENMESQQFYNGTIGSESIVFMPNGNYLIFQVPEGSPGSKNGVVTINDQDFSFEYQLESNSFTNPDNYLQGYFSDQQIQQTELENLQGDFIQDSIPGFEDIQSDLSTWNQIANDAQAELSALSNEETEKLAQLLDANSEWIQRLDDALLLRSIYSMNKSSKEDCRALIEEGRTELQQGELFGAAGTAIEAYWCALTFEEKQYDDLDNDFERGTLLLTDTELSPGFGVLNTLMNLVGRKMDALTKELQGSVSSNGIADEILDVEKSAIQFENGEPEPIFAKIRFRSMNQNDINSSGPIGQTATFFNKIITSYNEMVEASNQPLIWRPEFTQSSVVRDFNRFLSVPSESVNNSDIVLITTQYVNDTWEVAFGNDGNEEEPSFNFELIYDDGYIQLEKIISAGISGVSTFTDPRDGQIYDIVVIGNQTWFAENLRYSGNISQVSGNVNWAEIYNNSTQQPAWCYYNDNPSNDETYGKLYNWYAVQTNNLCPSGWHIPTDAEWSILSDYLGGESVAGGKMKTTSVWNSPNTGASNSSGFSSFPSGLRNYSGNSLSFGNRGYFWSSSEVSIDNSWGRTLYYNYSISDRSEGHKTNGMSCRCLQD